MVAARAKTTAELYAFSRKVAGIGALDDLLWATAFQIASMLNVRTVLLMPVGDGRASRSPPIWTSGGISGQLKLSLGQHRSVSVVRPRAGTARTWFSMRSCTATSWRAISSRRCVVRRWA